MKGLFRGSVLGAGVAVGACTLSGLDGLSGEPAVDPATDAAPETEPNRSREGGADGAPDSGVDAAAEAARAYRAAVLADRPIAYWPFDEAPGAAVATDVVGAHAASLIGRGRFGERGVAGTGLVLFEDNSYLDVNNPIDFIGAAPFALEAWAIPSFGQPFQNVFERRDGMNFGIVLYFRQPAGAQLEQAWSGAARGGWADVPTTPEFIHVVASFDGQTVRFYVNGAASPNTYQATGGPSKQTARFAIGTAYAGSLDELAVYDHALTPERVTLHHMLGRAK